MLLKPLRWMIASCALLACTLASAQSYPNKPIKLVVPFTAGGGTDVLARIVAKHWAQKTGQPVLVENPTGAGGNIGAAQVARAPADGYTLMVSYVGTQAINPSLYKTMPWNPDDIEPIAEIGTYPFLLVAHPSVPANTLQELVSYARANPNKLSYGSSGIGSGGHLMAALFASRAGIQMTHVPYRGAAPMSQDLLAGRLQLAADNWTGSGQQIQAGRLKVIGVMSSSRLPELPKVPTMAEQGLPGVEQRGWFGVFAPHGMPAAVLHSVRQTAEEIVNSKEFRDQAAALGVLPPTPDASKDFKSFVNAEIKRWGVVVKEANASAE
jgi:tripartite-type tricarboxylate transporter receptor subunit TctC